MMSLQQVVLFVVLMCLARESQSFTFRDGGKQIARRRQKGGIDMMSIPVSDRQRSIRSLNNLGSILSSVVLASALARPVEAKTYFDTDVYGEF